MFCKEFLTLIVAIMCNCTQGCHSGLKKRSLTKREQTMTSFFSRCLSDSAGKDFRWEAITRFAIEDTAWYDETSHRYCRRNRDTDECWREQLDFFVNPLSDYSRHIKRCIREYSSRGSRTSPHFVSAISAVLPQKKSGRRKRSFGSTLWLSLLQRRRWLRLGNHLNPLTTTRISPPANSYPPNSGYFPGIFPSPSPTPSYRRVIAPTAAPPSPTIRTITARFVPPHQTNSRTLPTRKTPIKSNPSFPNTVRPPSSGNGGLSPLSTYWRTSTRHTTIPFYPVGTPLVRSKQDATSILSSAWFKNLSQDDKNVILLMLAKNYPSTSNRIGLSTNRPSPSSPYVRELGGTKSPVEPGTPKTPALPRVPGIPPHVTATVCDESSITRFEGCVSTSVEHPIRSRDHERRLMSDSESNALSKDDFSSIFRFFRQNYSPCLAIETWDVQANAPVRRCSPQARSFSTLTCLPKIMLRLVRSDSDLRRLFNSCARLPTG